MSKKSDLMGFTRLTIHMAASRSFKRALKLKRQAGDIYSNPNESANAMLTPAEAPADRQIQRAPHSSITQRRAVVHQLQAAMSALPYGYLRKSTTDGTADKQKAAKTITRSAQAVLMQRTALAILAAYKQTAVNKAKRTTLQATHEAAEQTAGHQAALEAAEREAQQRAALEAAEREAQHQAALEAAEREAQQQAALEAAEQAARQTALEAAEREAQQQAEQQAAKIDAPAAEDTVPMPMETAEPAAPAAHTEAPGSIALDVLKMLTRRKPLTQQTQDTQPGDVPVMTPVQTADTAAPVTDSLAAQTAAGIMPSAAQLAADTVPPAAVPSAGAFGVPAKLHFCTVAGSSYLFKVVTLYRSLEAYSADFMLYVCCIDDETKAALDKLHLPRCIAVSADALGDNGLVALRSQRSASEFCWTLKSHFLLWLLTEKGLTDAVYLDSDVAFFSDPRQLYDDWGTASVYLCRQRDLDWVEQKYGKYQAGVIGFRNDEQGVAAVRWWRDKCRAWCFAAPETGQYGDQKYLDDIPALFHSVRISTHRGIDAAPWNTVYNNNYPISVSDGKVQIDGDPLVAYHFACVDVIDERHFDLWNLSGITIGQTISNAIYVPYLAKLRESITEVQAKTGRRYYSGKAFSNAKTPYIYSEKNLSISHWDGNYGFCTIASKQYAARTLALYSSLEKHAGNFHLWICCMDDTAYAILSAFNMSSATLVKLSEVETAEVRATRASKKLYEYCWTMKPLLCQYVFENYNISRLLYCDADMYFFASPQAVHNEWRRYDTFLNLQRGSAKLEAVHGMYQAGLIGFSKTPESMRTLNWWAGQCTAWCYDNHDDHSRWGDQKYLTQIPNLFSSIKVNNRYGLLAAPWNIVMNNSKDLPVHTDAGGTVWIGDESLTCFHFGSINVLGENSFDLWKHEPLNFDPAILESIYKPYLTHLRSIYGEIGGKGFNTADLFENGVGARNPYSLEG